MVKKNIQSDLEFDSFAGCILALNLLPMEIDFLKCLTRLYGFELREFIDLKSINPLKKELVLLKELNSAAIENLLDWCIQITVVGKAEAKQIQKLKDFGIVRFWDCEKFPLEKIPLFYKKKHSEQKIACLCSDPIFTRQINSILKDFQIHLFATNDPINFFFSIQNENYDFLIIDWDISDSMSQNISNELKKIKLQKGKLPAIFGLKDYSASNLFANLSIIQEFCKILFSKEDILQLLSLSLPLEPKKEISTKLEKIINWSFSKDHKLISYSISEDSVQIAPEIHLQKKQYEWMF